MKTETTYTRGPLEVVQPHGRQTFIVQTKRGEITAEGIYNQADANLYADAPDLLAALKAEHTNRVGSILAEHRAYDPRCSSCAAIAKAEVR